MTSPWLTFGARRGAPEPTPPTSSPLGLILWAARLQTGPIVVSILLGMGWVLCQALWPLLLGAAVQSATEGFRPELFPPLLALAGLAVAQSLFGTFNYRSSYSNYLRTTASLARLVGRRITATGRAATRERSSGELVVTSTSDAVRVGRVFDVIPRLVGAVVAWLLVTALLFTSATALGLIALIGVPVSCAVLALLVRPLERTQAEQRGKLGMLSAIGGDAAAGLRILRGIGGEDEFVARYRSQSQTVRWAGVRIAGVQSWLFGAQVLLPSITIALVVGTGARLVLGGDWTAGSSSRPTATPPS
ncbi:ABC transporter transmembrane domain-containing protein [Naasia aerilata]|uniref:ABC transmembrane type-1 domain-containing protein n=1 Tax=Naasia aerilata TaxID=1162966 RepID=A0ABM8G8B5_9MICO|nr:ABC transporter transmembrane domain-containing protein [Naasia aerilata]BDZ44413.1 hypothetical protein GCM10025866_03220 [Naasia aerilata]